ncbi:hypothetical protein F2Q69_00013585 [Brassica cretica]|uniref:Uncharacterized protein n=1 Tax=Brassica cretica TaxID=69181 RepID=A0A8S9R9N9_BRACR|nr:hypothetical protein F2Q69_00013585 [Brassica cretica]
MDKHDELPKATQREAELQRKIDDLQGQVTGLHRTQEETNPELSSEFQIQKEKIDEHSKQLEKSAEKLSQLESENLTLRDEKQALNAASNKKRANLPTTAPGGDASTREKAKDAQTYDMEDSDSKPEPDKEASDGMARAKSPMIVHLHQMFSYTLDAMQSMMGQQVKWPQKMKAPDSFRNPGFWCDFHRDHGHKTEDCVALKIEVNELLRKGHLREFLS